MNEIKRFTYDNHVCFVLHDADGSGEFFAVMFFIDPANCSDYWTTFGLCLDPSQYMETGRTKTSEEAEQELVRLYKQNWLSENPDEGHRWN